MSLKRLGMNARTGSALSADDHLKQSIAKVLFTPLGTRPMRRDFGSVLPELIDQPLNGVTLQRVYAAVAMALRRWEPRIDLRRVGVQLAAGSAELELTVVRRDTPVDALTVFTFPIRAQGQSALSSAAA